MYFEKVFHVHQSPAETRRQLGRVHQFRPRVRGLRKVVATADGVLQFDCEVARGLEVHAVLAEVPGEAADQIVFRSTVGNVQIAGVLSLAGIRPELTEVQLAVEYTLHSLTGRVVDFCTRRVERYVEEALRVIVASLNGDLPSAYRRAAAGFIESQPLGAN